MFKRKLLVIIIPVLATSVLVGAGFSAWYFNSTAVTPVDDKFGVSITNKTTTTGTLSSDLGSAKLVLDQGGSKSVDSSDATKHI